MNETEEDDSLSSSDDVDIEDAEETYEGQTNSLGQPHGRGTLYFDAERKDRFHGHFKDGVKEGKGCFYFSDGSTLSGTFQDGCLHGTGHYLFEDGSSMVGTYENGELNGPSKEYDGNGKMTFMGQYKNNVRCGLCHFYFEFGGRIFGVVDKEGKLTGKDIVYVYPDEKIFLKGNFQDGDMISTFLAEHDGIGGHENPYSYNKITKGVKYFKDVSSSTTISSHPLVNDCYEEYRVTVKKSSISGAGEGLFSLISADAGEVMSFYNGIRIKHQEVDARDWKYNDNTISLDDEIVIDVPEPWCHTQHYRASLGHKANHSFDPNCKYDRFDHPRFGKIKCIRTIRAVKSGEELTVAYGYDHNKLETDAPDWYKEELKHWNNNGKARTHGL